MSRDVDIRNDMSNYERSRDGDRADFSYRYLKQCLVRKITKNSKEQANKNYDLLGSPVTPDPSTLVLDELRIRHPAAFDKEVERLLASVVEEAGLPFPLTDFQVAHYPVDLLC